MVTRRTFIAGAMLGAATLAAGGIAWRAASAAPPTRYVFTPRARTVLAAIVPTMVGPMLPAEGAARAAAIERTVDAVRQTVAALPVAAQGAIGDLFALLGNGPARRLLAGLPDWEEAKPAELAEFLQGWRTHKVAMLRGAYAGLHDLILGAWYAQPDHWTAIGYPGPIKELN